ncbi:hypothetical protein [Ornithinimicrobium cerasi]|uniref:Uncharacterized protein n=1 Tax=Ornithinimicrobium cerasi TaxID=2248773 RepID=A0A285VW48_9MICO|nr:hypothetical protein [Ornithinimicrobium cerasi]SOC57476.1 hypothetical protein SAMN05421879_11313 [Ornithinimicrobium cerasi]
MPRHRYGAWALVAAVLASWLLGAVLGGRPLSAAGSAAPPVLAPVEGAPVVLVGVPGLTWDLVGPTTTPVLERMSREGASAALVVRGTHEVTCAADAWLTLGAGQRAATDVAGCVDAQGERRGGDDGSEGGTQDGTQGGTDGATGAAYPVVGEVVGASGVDPRAWHRWQEAAERRALGPQLGTLARLVEEAGGCVAAYGAGAALGAAGPDGEVEQLQEQGVTAQGAPDLVPSCDLHLVAAPEVLDGDRGGVLAGVDAAVGDLVAQLPEGSRLVVAGTGHTAGRAEATVLLSTLVAEDGGPRSLGSVSTRQVGLVQLTDLTVGLLQAVGVRTGAAQDDGALAGGPPVLVAAEDGAREDPADHARELAAGVSDAKRLAPWALGALAVLVLPVLALGVGLRRRRVVAVVATLAMAVPVATFLAGILPWWRAGQPVVALVGAILAAAALVTVLAWAGPWRRDPLGPVAVVAGVTLAVLGVDVLASSRLGLVSVLGLQPVTAGRFYGQGNVGYGTMLGALLVAAAVLVSRLPRREAAAAVLVLGVGATVVNAAPQAGADFGGVPGTVLATGLLLLSALGLPWRPRSMALLALAGAGVAGAVMVLDWARGPESRTHLGDFVQSTLDGEATGIVGRKLSQSLGILVSYPLSWLAVLALVLVTVVAVTRRPGWTAALWRESGIRPALLAGAVAMTLTWALNDSGIAAVALTLALLIATAIVVVANEPVVRAGRGSARSPSTRSHP